MTRLHVLVLPFFVSALALGLSGCWDDANDGPAEEAGEAVDEAVKDTERAIEDATD